MNPAPPGPLAEWFVVFIHADSAAWHYVLRRGFRHVYAFGYDAPAGRWLVFDAAFDGFYIRAFDGDTIDALVRGVAAGGGTILKAKTEAHRVKRPLLFATCVTAIARLLGLPGACALSPYGLYRTLLARGAVHAFGTGANLHGQSVWRRCFARSGAGGAAARS